ncbi:putative metal-binding protein [Geothermobacter ehrlichii]|uniref:Putative metal-binding protein n=1 Tax=Geothermobacter ehrlichii TaxID=213224 RepID=A0A5D3WGP2_9BACT|nr:DUF1847 domain-containing protein [Geothermobacter ehrlichii]TYO94892.1 putative metal-binding protein [Geothermobacter ehrlichii]
MIECNGCVACKCYQGHDCSKKNDFSEINIKSRTIFDEPNIIKILKTAAEIEARHYMQWNRLEELIGFCQQMEYKKVGIAMCVGLAREAKTLVKVLSQYFNVFSICCKNSGISKDDYGMPHIKQDRYEATCNPIGQALILNKNQTDINIILGLCIGHDMLFTKYSDAPVTTFAVKDRVLAHNPLAALYSGYCLKKLQASSAVSN